MAKASTKTTSASGKRPAKSKGPAKGKAAATAAVAEDAPFDGGVDAGAEAEQGEVGAGSGRGKRLVIVESPAKAKTINKYLGSEYKVVASVGHVRDLPSRNPKGVKSPVPGVDLEHDFAPTYEVMDAKSKVIGELKRTARSAREIWFATDPDREGEAIAWHVAEELGVKPETAKRVMFNAITKAEIQRAFDNPHPINMDRVNAQQARRILDRIVGYQVSPLLWKKVARGLSAGRVQSVAVRLIVEREREIRAFMPDEFWEIGATFTKDLAKASGLTTAWAKWYAAEVERALNEERKPGRPKRTGPSVKEIDAWLSEHACFRAALVEVGGKKFDLRGETGEALAARAQAIAAAAGMRNVRITTRQDDEARGPAKFVRTLTGEVDTSTPYRVTDVTTKRVSTRPSPPFITSTLQQAAANRLGFTAKRTMGAAQQLYQGVDLPGEGPTALITYMRTDSTHLSADALSMVRTFIPTRYGQKYLPEKPNFYTSSNKDAQEAHEAIRPTNVNIVPDAKLKSVLPQDLFRLYQIIWERFVACQMVPAQWDSTAATIVGGVPGAGVGELTFRATGRVLVFDGFYKATGVPGGADEQTLPPLGTGTKLAPVLMEPEQKFTQPPARYSEASLIKVLESEGIGRPSTYASIISVVQERKYVELVDRRFYATDLGEAVTDKLIEAFPDLMDVGYTRDMESKLDKVEEDHLDWVEMLHEFYTPFVKRLGVVESTLKHAKAETTPAPYKCPTCGSGTVYRLGKNGRFLSCSTYPDCKYASPVDRNGKPTPASTTNVACHLCGRGMTKRTGRFGAFLGCSGYGAKENPCSGILKLDKKGHVLAPSAPPFTPEPALGCPKCQSAMYLRPGKYGPWLGCSKFPKCRGRGDFKKLDEASKVALLKALEKHQAAHPTLIIKTLDGRALTGADGKPLPDAPIIGKEAGEETLEAVADELGV